MSLNVKKGDTVLVIAGKDNGKTGKVIAASPKTGRVTVEGVNIIKKHVKARSAQQQSEIKQMEGTLDASNVMIICPACGKATRVAMLEKDGKKIRVCKKCNAALDVKAEKADKKAKKAKAAKADKAENAEAPAKKTKKSKKTEAEA